MSTKISLILVKINVQLSNDPTSGSYASIAYYSTQHTEGAKKKAKIYSNDSAAHTN